MADLEASSDIQQRNVETGDETGRTGAGSVLFVVVFEKNSRPNKKRKKRKYKTFMFFCCFFQMLYLCFYVFFQKNSGPKQKMKEERKNKRLTPQDHHHTLSE